MSFVIVNLWYVCDRTFIAGGITWPSIEGDQRVGYQTVQGFTKNQPPMESPGPADESLKLWKDNQTPEVAGFIHQPSATSRDLIKLLVHR